MGKEQEKQAYQSVRFSHNPSTAYTGELLVYMLINLAALLSSALPHRP